MPVFQQSLSPPGGCVCERICVSPFALTSCSGNGGLVKLISHRKWCCCSKPHIVSRPYCLILAVVVIFLQEAHSIERPACTQWPALGGVGGVERAASNLLLKSHSLIRVNHFSPDWDPYLLHWQHFKQTWSYLIIGFVTSPVCWWKYQVPVRPDAQPGPGEYQHYWYTGDPVRC